MVELYGMESMHLLPLLLSPLWPEVIVLVMFPSTGRLEIFNLYLYLKPFRWEKSENYLVKKNRSLLNSFLVLDSNSRNYFAVHKQVSCHSFKNVAYKCSFESHPHIYIYIYIYMCVCVCGYVCMYVCMYIYVYIYIYIYVCVCVCLCVCNRTWF